MKRFFRKLLSGFANPTSRRTPALRDRKARLSLESLEDRRLMSTLVTSPNPQAPIIPNVQIETVYLGSAWTGPPSNPEVSAELTAEAQDLNQFFGTITNSPYMDGLSQYSMTTASGTVIRPGYGSFARTDFVPGQPVANPTVPEAGIQAVLANEILSGRLDAPNGNTLYMVFMPPGVEDAQDVGHTGHHLSFPYGSGTAYYATVEHPLTGVNPTGGAGNATNFQKLTEIASHEMVEAITDPMVDVPGKQAWGDDNSADKYYLDEIGDITQAMEQNVPGGAMGVEGLTGYGYVVQKYWSNQDNTNIIPGGINYQGISTVPTLANLAFSLTDQTGRTIAGNWGYLASESSDYSQATFSGTFDGQTATVLVQTNGGQQLAVTISSASGSLLFSGVISQPSGSWVNRDSTGELLAPSYVELYGNVTENGQSVLAFGEGEAMYTQSTGPGYGGSSGGMGTSGGDNYNNPLRFHRPNLM
jgi:hypothetical protein